MEIKTSLNKPYTEKEKIDFIVQQNHNLGYNIVKTDTALEAWGKTEEEIQAEENKNKKLEIQKKLDELDKKRIRAVCEPTMKTETQSWLDYYNEEIKKLREML